MSAKKARKIPGKIPESGAAGELTFGIRSAGVRRRANPGGFEAAAGGRERGLRRLARVSSLPSRRGFRSGGEGAETTRGFPSFFPLRRTRTGEARDWEPAPVAAFTWG